MIETLHLSKSFGQKMALNDVSFSLREGKTTALFGHNGAGKTTLIKMLLGLSFPDKGHIHFQKKPITNEDRRIFGYMPEVTKLPEELTPFEMLHYKLSSLTEHSKKENKKLIENSIEEAGLQAFSHTKIKNLSKGLKQRLAWSFCSVTNPSIFILDEPFSGMDPIAEKAFTHWLKQIQTASKTIFLCCHNIETTLDLADDIIILQKSKVCFSATDHNIKKRDEIISFFYGEIT